MKTKLVISLISLLLSLTPLGVFAQSKTLTEEDVLSIWKEYTVRVTCITLDEYGNKKSYSDGSGFLIDTPNRGISVLTNSHLLYTKNNKLSDYCNIYFPSSKETIKVTKKNRFSSKYQDRATLVIKEPTQSIKDLIVKASVVEKDCSQKQMATSTSIAILGYPTGSDKTKVSVSKGSIVDYDKEYIISSATVVSGYSGGIAISLKDNCYLGIPTFAKRDDLSKSLILNVNKFK